MTTQIILEGDTARVVEMNVLQEVSLERLAPNLVKYAPTVLPRIPDNTVSAWYNPNEKSGAYLVEVEPRIVHMRIYNGGDDWPSDDYSRFESATDNYAVFHLPMPWQYFLMGFTLSDPDPYPDEWGLRDTRLFWRPYRMEQNDTALWHAAIPNVSGGDICWGDTPTDCDNLVDCINERVNTFYSTNFNADYGYRMPAGYDSYSQWEEDTEDAYRRWRAFEYDPVYRSLDQLTAGYNAADRATLYATQGTPMIPTPPPVMSIARAREFIEELAPDVRNILLRAANTMTLHTGEVAE